ncbi:type II-A CRISPR-associated protein Csn2 [Leuconostoc gasicomitatum]|uniref:Type II-A CRISPR-associated protein Csn2 n=1 Tax=Leuconostoc gasicomitatum TaxID=115778 RepID=A0A9Q3SX25_9LACO|nr:type II-A CRISPR-associated protein Csn2 [Leuconostoc gasicomitatum]MBZ5959824.1 type II-A CRISPR-associated protein Csn2 [Leuconostoc gasicomitatum]MBZ5962545.1 type II-A CRISPR-associated protein Csn2 [Leuconostoc gasicomitatum]MBZ5969229.1 type II-A CRISPR-associated protein Csn2 [Leuconostoc gasicomitatum]MBZ5993199.1 type II-A CRISPR-associated protein Csn2 [Leuconostoc gasicomitatum]MBZ5997755.1 type II-A CRISPR-associated protein Csn2 [Leuconostoc gasicomitatum]
MNYSIVCFPNNPIKIDSGLTMISIANHELYWQLSTGLKETSEDVTLGQNGHIVDVNKTVMFIGDIGAQLDVNKLYQKNIVNTMKNYADDQALEVFYKINSELNHVLENIILENNLPFYFQTEFNIVELINEKKIRIETLTNSSGFGKIEDVVSVAGEFLEQRLIVFTNLYLLLSVDQIDYLNNLAKTMNLCLISLNLTQNPVMTKQGLPPEIFIDEDFVQFGAD